MTRTRTEWRSPAAIAILLAAVAATADAVSAQTPEPPAGQERCYGVAPAGQNDGIDDRAAPGSSTVDYQGNAWVWVETGTCLRMALPVQPDGTPRRGAIEPIARDRP